MSTEKEIKVAEILKYHVLPYYQNAANKKLSVWELTTKHLDRGICYFLYQSAGKEHFEIVKSYFDKKIGPTCFLCASPGYLAFNGYDHILGITKRIAWMENFIATHLTQQNKNT